MTPLVLSVMRRAPGSDATLFEARLIAEPYGTRIEGSFNGGIQC